MMKRLALAGAMALVGVAGVCDRAPASDLGKAEITIQNAPELSCIDVTKEAVDVWVLSARSLDEVERIVI